MRPVDRYRAWALRGPFLLHHAGGVLKIGRPPSSTLLAFDSRQPLLVRVRHLAGKRADELLALLGDEDHAVMIMVADDLAEFFGCVHARRVASLVDRYGPAIANDLQQVYGLDLGALFRGEVVPDELADRLDGLPRHSRLSEALAQDDELVDMTPSSVNESGGPEVRFTEWTPEAERLAKLIDVMGAVLSAMGAMAGSRVNFPPEPRPVGAAARAKARQEHDAYMEIVSDVAEAQARWLAEHPDTHT